MKRAYILSVILIMLVWGMAMAENKEKAGADFASEAPAELKQFAFWLGEWEFTHSFRKKDGTSGESTGRNSISVTFDGWGLLEDFTTGIPGRPYHGGSITIYNKNTKEFSQSWADSNGFVMTFAGKWQDNQMVLYSPELEQNGKKYQTRLVWKNIKKDTMDWSYERSDDKGKTWKSQWDISYRRIK